MTKTTTGDQLKLKPVNPSAAAIDIRSTMHMAAVNPDSTDTPVRAFEILPTICTIWPVGANPVAFRQWRWNHRGSIGFWPLRSLSNTD